MYARLAEDAEVRMEARTPPRWARPLGIALALALVAGTIVLLVVAR